MGKNVLTAVFIFVMVPIFYSTAIAQLPAVARPGLVLGGNIIYANPKTNFKNAYQFGAGGELFAGVGIRSTYVVGSVGIIGFNGRSGYKNLSMVPVKIGLKKYFLLKRIFINGDVGVATVKVDDATAKAFTAGYGAGARLFGLEAAIYYNAFKNLIGYTSSGFSNTMQLKLGWGFSL